MEEALVNQNFIAPSQNKPPTGHPCCTWREGTEQKATSGLPNSAPTVAAAATTEVKTAMVAPAGWVRKEVHSRPCAALETAVVMPHEGQGMSYMSIHEQEGAPADDGCHVPFRWASSMRPRRDLTTEQQPTKHAEAVPSMEA